jgi:hypothetical protein
VGHVGEHLPPVRGRGAELAERGEEVVVPRLALREVLHGPGPDDGLPERGIGEGVGGRTLAGAARRCDGGHGGVDAEAVFGGELDEVLGPYRAGEVIVQVTALGQVPEEAVGRDCPLRLRVQPGVGPDLGGGHRPRWYGYGSGRPGGRSGGQRRHEGRRCQAGGQQQPAAVR